MQDPVLITVMALFSSAAGLARRVAGLYHVRVDAMGVGNRRNLQRWSERFVKSPSILYPHVEGSRSHGLNSFFSRSGKRWLIINLPMFRSVEVQGLSGTDLVPVLIDVRAAASLLAAGTSAGRLIPSRPNFGDRHGPFH